MHAIYRKDFLRIQDYLWIPGYQITIQLLMGFLTPGMTHVESKNRELNRKLHQWLFLVPVKGGIGGI